MKIGIYILNLIASIIRFLFQRNRITILVYHNISKSLFEEHACLLARSYKFISFKDFIDYYEGKLTNLPKFPLIFTFDDGYKENYDLLSIFKKYSICPTIYLCTNTIDTNRIFWSLSIDKRNENIKFLLHRNFEEVIYELEKKGFNAKSEKEARTFLSRKEIEEMKECVDFQSHTVNHANLAYATNATIENELDISKKSIEELGLYVHTICYPFSFYSKTTISIAKKLGYKFGVSVEPFYNSKKTNPFRLKRISMNEAKPSFVLIRASGLYVFIKEFIFRKKGIRLFIKQ